MHRGYMHQGQGSFVHDKCIRILDHRQMHHGYKHNGYMHQIRDTCIMETCIRDTCIIDTCIINTCIIDTCIMYKCTMERCIMDTCIVDSLHSGYLHHTNKRLRGIQEGRLCVGHTACAPEVYKGRSQASPNGHLLEVGPGGPLNFQYLIFTSYKNLSDLLCLCQILSKSLVNCEFNFVICVELLLVTDYIELPNHLYYAFLLITIPFSSFFLVNIKFPPLFSLKGQKILKITVRLTVIKQVKESFSKKKSGQKFHKCLWSGQGMTPSTHSSPLPPYGQPGCDFQVFFNPSFTISILKHTF